MKNPEKVSIAAVIIFCLCAVGWITLWIVGLVQKDIESFLHNTLCAILTSICAVIWIIRYCKSKKENE